MCSMFMLIYLTACQRDIPEPETKGVSFINPLSVLASENSPNRDESFHVNYFVKHNILFVECIVGNISFRSHPVEGKQSGKLIVYIDGNKYREVSTAAFIIRDLKSGEHKIKLQVVNSNGQPTSVEKEFMVMIPRGQ
jgi:hypothetical protein